MNNQDNFKKWFKKYFLGEIAVSDRVKKVFWGVVFILGISLILIIDFIPDNIDLKVGQVNRTDVRAPRTLTFVDEEKTNELREAAAQAVRRVYEEDTSINKKVNERISMFFSDILVAKEELEEKEDDEGTNTETGTDIADRQESIPEEKPDPEKLILSLEKKYPEIAKESIVVLMETPGDIIEQIQDETIRISNSIYQKKFTPEDLPKIKDEAVQEAMTLDFIRELRLVIANILEGTLRPNMIFDQNATEKNRKEAMEKVAPVTHTVRRDEIIIRSGDVVTEDDIKILEALGLQKSKINYLSIIGTIILISIMIILASLYLKKYQQEVWADTVKLVFLEVMVIIILLLAKIIDVLPAVNHVYLPYLLPVAVASILISVLLNTQMAIMATVFISFLSALVFNNDYNVALLGFVSGLVGIFSVSRVSQRNDLVRAGFNVSGVLVFLVSGFTLINPVDNWWNLLGNIGIALANGVLVAIFANGLLPYLENIFGLTSSVKFLELSNPSHPLLSRMVFEAPGTYNHSLVVANLAETAANNIGADSLLARVGSYYHDIGKLRRPYFFIENYIGNENPHEKLSPNLSALIIKTHVKDGVELAKENKLPSQIIDIIQQHHGTGLISYFYQQALEANIDSHDNIEEGDFRYDGPKPQSKEAAIVMLADVVEAAVRSKNFNRANLNRLEGLIRELVKEKLIEGQLDESDLSLGDLDIITESFVKILAGIYHQRVEYPENILKEMKRADKNDKNSNK
ncbi:MAG: HDIG domain-containing protein [Halanaerobiaceae bacterium]|nr:HDIG domain-containing protein [Halanaerobiaceae bacterium]